MTVSEALNFSHEAHERYREALPRRVANGSGGTVAIPGDAEVAGAALAEACRYRAEAHVLDAAKIEPAWTDEAASHDHLALLDFYVEQLTREPEIVQETTVDLGTVVDSGRKALTPDPVPVIAPVPVMEPPIRLQSGAGIFDTVSPKL